MAEPSFVAKITLSFGYFLSNLLTKSLVKSCSPRPKTTSTILIFGYDSIIFSEKPFILSEPVSLLLS